MELKTYTLAGLKFVFEKIKFKVLHYILHDFIRQRQGLSKDQISCSKASLLTVLSSNIVTHSNSHIKGDKYFFFIRVSAANVLLKQNYLKSRVETQYRKIIFITPSIIKLL